MPLPVHSVVPVVYVVDPARSCAFYQLVGFSVAAEGTDGEWRWVLLQSGPLSVMLAAGSTAPPVDPGPAVLYVVLSDLEAVRQALEAAGHTVQHLGYPDHAPGGEARATDPDGHGLMLGQRTAVRADAEPDAGDPVERRGGTLQAAAEAVRRRGGASQRCQIGLPGGVVCDADAEVKLADAWGDTAWACLKHADEVLVNARGAYIATEDAQGLAQYLRLRRLPRTQPAD